MVILRNIGIFLSNNAKDIQNELILQAKSILKNDEI